MGKTLCVLVAAIAAAFLPACSSNSEIKKKDGKPQLIERMLKQETVITNEDAERRDKREAYMHYHQGDRYLMNGMLRAAFDEYFKAMELDKQELYFNRLGLVSIKLRRYGDARYFFGEIEKINPGTPQNSANIAYLELMDENFEEAEQGFRNAAKKLPGDIIINYNLAQTILLSILKEVSSKEKGAGLSEGQVERLKEAKRYYEHVCSISASEGSPLNICDEMECKVSSKTAIERIDQVLARCKR